MFFVLFFVLFSAVSMHAMEVARSLPIDIVPKSSQGLKLSRTSSQISLDIGGRFRAHLFSGFVKDACMMISNGEIDPRGKIGNEALIEVCISMDKLAAVRYLIEQCNIDPAVLSHNDMSLVAYAAWNGSSEEMQAYLHVKRDLKKFY